MRTAHENRVRAALWRLTAPDASPDEALDTPPPLLLRTPSIVLLWIAALVALVGLLALSRVQMPHADSRLRQHTTQEVPCHRIKSFAHGRTPTTALVSVPTPHRRCPHIPSGQST
jgi:cytochrome c-type biogenesis protein CcmH/NrfG